MKKRTISLLLVLLVVFVTGCDMAPTPPPAEQPQTTQQSAAPSQTAPDTSSFIGEDKAKEIALERAGITADGVRFDRVELDKDNGVWQYEVEFTKDRTEYDADIKADDGTVLSFETDYRD